MGLQHNSHYVAKKKLIKRPMKGADFTMKTITKIFACISFVFAFCCVAIGYAVVQDTLTVGGSVSIKANDKIYAVAVFSGGQYNLTFLCGEQPTEDDITTVYEVSKDGYSPENPPPWSALSNLYTVEIDGEFKSPPSMAYWFYGCSQLESIDLSGLDTSDVTDFSHMFSECTCLTSICVGRKFTVNSSAFDGNMFYNCEALKGGAGTEFTSDKINGEYAKIDGGAAAPGYLTYENYVIIFDGKSDGASNIPPLRLYDNDEKTFVLTDVSEPSHKWAEFNGWEVASDSSNHVKYNSTEKTYTIQAVAPCTIKIQAVWNGLGATTKDLLSTELADGNGIIGGGKWEGGMWDNLNSTNKHVEITIYDGNFAGGGMRIDGSTVIVNGGTFDISSYIADAKDGQASKLIINGGDWIADTITITSLDSSRVVVIITGGTFKWDPRGYVAEGHTAVLNEDDGTWTVVCNNPINGKCVCAATCNCTAACSAEQIATNCIACKINHEKCKHAAQPEP